MRHSEFRKECKKFVVNDVNSTEYVLPSGYIPHIFDYNVFVVWISKVLQNNKALLSTTVDGDTRYYEITYNGDKDEFYFDAYDKIVNRCLARADITRKDGWSD